MPLRQQEETDMASTQNFRASFNGFNRDDVVNYISYMTAKHENQINELRTQAQELRQELERCQTPIEHNDELTQLRAELEQAKAQLDEKDHQIQQLISSPQDKVGSMREQELEAYRRAESSERRAMERVEQMFHQANGVLGELVNRMQDNTDEVNGLAERLRADLEALEHAARNTQKLMEDATAMMAAVQP